MREIYIYILIIIKKRTSPVNTKDKQKRREVGTASTRAESPDAHEKNHAGADICSVDNGGTHTGAGRYVFKGCDPWKSHDRIFLSLWVTCSIAPSTAL